MDGGRILDDLRLALGDPRVAYVLELTLRDALIRRRIAEIRREGATVQQAVERVADGFGLSEEHVRTILYRKGRRMR